MNVVIAVLMKQLEDANIKDQEESLLERELAMQQEQAKREQNRRASRAPAKLLTGSKESSYSLNYTKAGATITYRLWGQSIFHFDVVFVYKFWGGVHVYKRIWAVLIWYELLLFLLFGFIDTTTGGLVL